MKKEKLKQLIEQEVKILQEEDDEGVKVGDLIQVQGDDYESSFEKLENEDEYTNNKSPYVKVKFLAKVIAVAETSDY